MIGQVSLLVILVMLVDHLPMPPPPANRGRGRPKFYADRLFLKALVIMIVRHLHKTHELLTVLAQPTAEMQAVQALLTQDGRYPTRRCRSATAVRIAECQTPCAGRRPWELLRREPGEIASRLSITNGNDCEEQAENTSKNGYVGNEKFNKRR